MHRFYYHSILLILYQFPSYTQFKLLCLLSIVTPIYFSLDFCLDRIKHVSTIQHVELIISNIILTPLSLSNPPLPPINHTDPPAVLPEPEDKLYTPPLSPENIEASPAFLTNDLPSIIVTSCILLNDDKFDVILNDPPSPPDHTPMVIVVNSPGPNCLQN